MSKCSLVNKCEKWIFFKYVVLLSGDKDKRKFLFCKWALSKNLTILFFVQIYMNLHKLIDFVMHELFKVLQNSIYPLIESKKNLEKFIKKFHKLVKYFSNLSKLFFINESFSAQNFYTKSNFYSFKENEQVLK
jgi:hypothetical protein